MFMLLLPLISIPLIFLAAVFVKPIVNRHFRWNICGICVAVASTWLLLFAFRIAGLSADPLLIGILMGMSITGVMYKMEAMYKKNGLRFLWIARLIIILGGFYFIVFLLREQWGVAFLVGVLSLIAMIITSFLIQGITHDDALKTARIDESEKSILKKLDNCC